MSFNIVCPPGNDCDVKHKSILGDRGRGTSYILTTITKYESLLLYNSVLMASCSYSLLLEERTSCGGSGKRLDDSRCITVRECNNDISQHLKLCKIWGEEFVVDEQTLLLARAGNSFITYIFIFIHIYWLEMVNISKNENI